MSLRIFLSATLLLSGWLVAQPFQPFAQSRDWQVLSSDHFDLYHHEEDQVMAASIVKLAELARHEVMVLFDVRPEQRYTLTYFPHAMELLYSNQSVGPQNIEIGQYFLPTQRGVLIHPGTTNDLYKAIKKEVTSFVMNEFVFGKTMRDVLQTKLLLHNSLWFWEGLREYSGEGWNFEDEMWINTLESQELLSLALEGQSELSRTVRKSIWHFISHEYGDQKLSEIVYLVNISNSIESGIVSVLGITLNSLTSRWRDYILTSADAQRQRKVDLSVWNDAHEVPLPKGHSLISFAWNHETGQIAAWLHNEGAAQLFIFEVDTREWSAMPVKMGIQSDFAQHVSLTDIPLAWSKDGSKLVTIRYRPKGLTQLVYLSLEAKELEVFDLNKSFRAVLDLAWSHDGATVVASILHDGQIDLYKTPAEDAQFKALTSDTFDDRDPSWSLDDQRIFFASNRDSSALGQSKPLWKLHEASYDIFSLDHLDTYELERLTKTPFSHERKPVATTSFRVKYLTDESGIWNLHAMNVFLREREAVSNIDVGLMAWTGDEETVILAAPYQGRTNLYRVESSLLTAPPTPELTLLRLEQIATFQAKERQKKREEAVKQLEREPAPEPAPTPEPDIAPIDTTQQETPRDQPVRYYIFDEEDQPYDIKRPVQREGTTSPTQPRRWSTGTQGRRALQAPDLDAMRIGGARKADNRFAADYLTLGLVYDPLAQVGLNLGLSFSDVLQHHRVEASVQPFIRNGFATLRYSYLPGKIDWYGEAGYLNRNFRHQTQLQSDSLVFRYRQARVTGGMILPLSSRSALNAQVGWHYIDRIDQQVQKSELFDAQDQVLRAGVQFIHNQVKQHERYRYAGWQGRIGWGGYYSLGQRALAFHRVQGELSHYLPLGKGIVFASRVSAGFTFPQQVTQYYLGGAEDQLLQFTLEQAESNSVAANSVDTSLYSFHYQDFIMAVRGFRPLVRDGSRYTTANFELRLPISRLMRSSLNAKALYSLEFIPFFDVGAVWSEGNPLNQKKPTDTRVITSGNITVVLQTLKSPFLMGFGSGMRMNVMGYSLRGDLAWGIDDQALTKPMILLTMGRPF